MTFTAGRLVIAEGASWLESSISFRYWPTSFHHRSISGFCALRSFFRRAWLRSKRPLPFRSDPFPLAARAASVLVLVETFPTRGSGLPSEPAEDCAVQLTPAGVWRRPRRGTWGRNPWWCRSHGSPASRGCVRPAGNHGNAETAFEGCVSRRGAAVIGRRVAAVVADEDYFCISSNSLPDASITSPMARQVGDSAGIRSSGLFSSLRGRTRRCLSGTRCAVLSNVDAMCGALNAR